MLGLMITINANSQYLFEVENLENLMRLLTLCLCYPKFVFNKQTKSLTIGANGSITTGLPRLFYHDLRSESQLTTILVMGPLSLCQITLPSMRF